jgi:hypothetical protein
MIINDKLVVITALTIFALIICILHWANILTESYWFLILFSAFSFIFGMTYEAFVPNVTIIEFGEKKQKFILDSIGKEQLSEYQPSSQLNEYQPSSQPNEYQPSSQPNEKPIYIDVSFANVTTLNLAPFNLTLPAYQTISANDKKEIVAMLSKIANPVIIGMMQDGCNAFYIISEISKRMIFYGEPNHFIKKCILELACEFYALDNMMVVKKKKLENNMVLVHKEYVYDAFNHLSRITKVIKSFENDNGKYDISIANFKILANELDKYINSDSLLSSSNLLELIKKLIPSSLPTIDKQILTLASIRYASVNIYTLYNDNHYTSFNNGRMHTSDEYVDMADRIINNM